MLGELNRKILNFMTRNIAKITGIVIVACFGLFLMSLSQYDRPTDAAAFAKTSVKVVSLSEKSGGSGVILESTTSGSKILTNKHVCRLIEGGGYVMRNDKQFIIHSYKKYPEHDLCLIKIMYDLGINTRVSYLRPDYFSKAYISGHPALMPPVLTKGNFSGRQIIRLVTGIKKCDEDDWKKYPVYCIFFNGLPVIESFESQLVTGTIMPGSSGSGVFDASGDIGGIVFAGRGKELSYAYIVPHEYIVDFVNTQDQYEWKRAGVVHDYNSFIRRLFHFEEECARSNRDLDNLCSYVKETLLWKGPEWNISSD